jgi:hypothetical protein
MGFDVLPGDGPVTLATGQTSALFPFEVAVEAQVMSLRFVALFRDAAPLGGEAPTFQLAAGHGVLVSVDPSSGKATLANRDGDAVGSVSCQRLPRDIFLLTITEIAENSGPWQLRIRNNDPETLRFLGFSSQHEDETPQPWMVLDEPNAAFAGAVLRFVGDQPAREIMVRNWGTGPLLFRDTAGTPLGGEDSPIVLASRPDRLEPHETGLLTTAASEVRATRVLTHFLLCNDTITAHREMRLELEPPPPHGPVHSPVDPATFCRRGCGCMQYLPPAQLGGACRRGICEHQLSDHQPI